MLSVAHRHERRSERVAIHLSADFDKSHLVHLWQFNLAHPKVDGLR
jgi:hypothetical protein